MAQSLRDAELLLRTQTASPPVPVQVRLFPLETEQQKLLDMLVELKAAEIQADAFRGFYGTPEQINARREEVERKVRSFVKRVTRAFPGYIPLESSEAEVE